MEEKTYRVKIAGELIKVENCENAPEEDSEEEVFQAIFEENNDNMEANFGSKENSQGLAFSFEIKTV